MSEVVSEDAIKACGLVHAVRIQAPDAPLSFMVHGRAGDVKVMGTFRRVFPANWNLIFVQAPYEDPIGGYCWWQMGPKEEMKRAALEESERLYDSLERLTDYYQLRPSSLHAAGFSQGAGMLSILLQMQPSYFDSLAMLAGFVWRVRTEKVGPESSEILFCHGSEDEVVSLQYMKQGRAHLEELGFSTTEVVDAVGHKVGTNGMRELKSFFAD